MLLVSLFSLLPQLATEEKEQGTVYCFLSFYAHSVLI